MHRIESKKLNICKEGRGKLKSQGPGISGRYCQNFIRRDVILNARNGLLPDDTLTLDILVISIVLTVLFIQLLYRAFP